MFEFIYIEEAVADHPRTLQICRRYPQAIKVPCERYGEVFNPRAQDFRLQKRQPALILARKHSNFVLPTPPGYGIGGRQNYYFSHMLNCVYDCRYCFLQGMFRSANLVLFVNYEDFQSAIEAQLSTTNEETFFFSGYDCDSLALESLSGFAEFCLPLFERSPQAVLELRTKSVQVKRLLERPAIANCVVAFSFTPESASQTLEEGVPPVAQRISAMARLWERGWSVGARFDPVLYSPRFQEEYRALFQQVFSRIPGEAFHSVSLGPFRLPVEMHKTMRRLYPEEKLLVLGLEERGGMVSYEERLAQPLLQFCEEEVLRYVPRDRFFPCYA